MEVEEDRIKRLIIMFDESNRLKKKLLDCNFAEALLSVIPICCMSDVEFKIQLKKNIDECEELGRSLETACTNVDKLKTKYEENTSVKKFVEFALFLSRFRDSNEDCDAKFNWEDIKFEQFDDRSLANSKKENEILRIDLSRANESISTLNLKLQEAHELLNSEKSQREGVESERNKLDCLAEKLCRLLYNYQERLGIPGYPTQANIQTSFDYSNITEAHDSDLISPHGSFFAQNCTPISKSTAMDNPACFDCDICDQSFQDKISFMKHITVHMETRKFCECEKCGSSFTVKNKGGDFVKCPTCDVDHNIQGKITTALLERNDGETGRAGNLRKQSEDEASNPLCHICGRVYSHEAKFKKHLYRIHQTRKFFRCSLCSLRFDNQNAKVEHVRNVHRGKNIDK